MTPRVCYELHLAMNNAVKKRRAEYNGHVIEAEIKATKADHWNGRVIRRLTWKLDGKPSSRAKIAAL
jgi:hypothetical protein